MVTKDCLLHYDVSLSFQSNLQELTRLIFASGLVFGTDIDDTVGINIKFHLDLRDTTWGRWNTRLERKEASKGRHVICSKESAILPTGNCPASCCPGQAHVRLGTP